MEQLNVGPLTQEEQEELETLNTILPAVEKFSDDLDAATELYELDLETAQAELDKTLDEVLNEAELTETSTKNEVEEDQLQKLRAELEQS